MRINLNKMPSPYGRDGRLLTREEYQRKCELVDKAHRELKEFAESLAMMCSFAKPKERLGGNFIKKG